jgi:hypothetical protein
MKIPSFYIENFKNENHESELERLLKNGTEIIILRLFKENNEQLSLVAFSGKKNHKKFDEGVELNLKACASGNEIDISELKVFLGDMEIGGKSSTGQQVISELKRMARKPAPHEKYVIVEPVLPEPASRYIHYELFTLPDLENSYRTAVSGFRLKSHPSPPYDGY